MDHPDLTESNFMGKSISLQWVKLLHSSLLIFSHIAFSDFISCDKFKDSIRSNMGSDQLASSDAIGSVYHPLLLAEEDTYIS